MGRLQWQIRQQRGYNDFSLILSIIGDFNGKSGSRQVLKISRLFSRLWAASIASQAVDRTWWILSHSVYFLIQFVSGSRSTHLNGDIHVTSSDLTRFWFIQLQRWHVGCTHSDSRSKMYENQYGSSPVPSSELYISNLLSSLGWKRNPSLPVHLIPSGTTFSFWISREKFEAYFCLTPIRLALLKKCSALLSAHTNIRLTGVPEPAKVSFAFLVAA